MGYYSQSVLLGATATQNLEDHALRGAGRFVLATAVLGFAETMAPLHVAVKRRWKDDAARVRESIKKQYGGVMAGVVFAFSLGGWIFERFGVRGVSLFSLTLAVPNLLGLGVMEGILYKVVLKMPSAGREKSKIIAGRGGNSNWSSRANDPTNEAEQEGRDHASPPAVPEIKMLADEARKLSSSGSRSELMRLESKRSVDFPPSTASKESTQHSDGASAVRFSRASSVGSSSLSLATNEASGSEAVSPSDIFPVIVAAAVPLAAVPVAAVPFVAAAVPLVAVPLAAAAVPFVSTGGALSSSSAAGPSTSLHRLMSPAAGGETLKDPLAETDDVLRLLTEEDPHPNATCLDCPGPFLAAAVPEDGIENTAVIKDALLFNSFPAVPDPVPDLSPRFCGVLDCTPRTRLSVGSHDELHRALDFFGVSDAPANYVNLLLAVSIGVEALTIGYHLSLSPLFLTEEFQREPSTIGVLFALGSAGGAFFATLLTVSSTTTTRFRRLLWEYGGIQQQSTLTVLLLLGVALGVSLAAVPVFGVHVAGILLLMACNDAAAVSLLEMQSAVSSTRAYELVGPLGQTIRRSLNVVTALTGPLLYSLHSRLPYIVAAVLTLCWAAVLWAVLRKRRVRVAKRLSDALVNSPAAWSRVSELSWTKQEVLAREQKMGMIVTG